MKYSKLSKEQFEALHEEFAVFLAAQSIDHKEWTSIKEEKPELAEKELEAFSDFVWEKVLNKTEYLDHFSSQSLNLFKVGEQGIQRILVRVNKEGIDLLKEEDFNWFLDHSQDGRIEYLKGQKNYKDERNLEIFDLIQKGSVVSDGKLYEGIYQLIQSN